MTLSATNFTTTGTAIPALPQKADSVLSSDFETFLQMLTTQARYQDPLEPIDSSEYSAQLAQFSMVEQQVLSNDLLSALSSQLGAGNMAQLAGWIGMEARSDAPAAFTGSPITIAPTPTANADRVQLVVYNADGAEVQRSEIGGSRDLIQWAGVTDDGTPFPAGLYRFAVESLADGELLASTPAQTYTRITEARTEGGQTKLILQGGTSVSSTEISALREPA